MTDVRPGKYTASASASGFVPGVYTEPGRSDAVEFSVAIGEEREHVDIVLQRGGVELKGTVFDASGGPVAGALVSAAPLSDRASVSAGESGVDGAFRLFVTPGRGIVSAQAEGYASARALYTAPTTEARIVMTPASTIVGRVVSAEGEGGVPNVTVSAEPERVSAMAFGSSATTDGSGSFSLSDLASGVYLVSARGDSWRTETPIRVALGVAETSSPIVVHVRPGSLIAGTIRIGTDFCAPNQGGVRLTGPVSMVQNVGAEGLVRFEGVAAGEYSVTVNCRGARSLTESLSVGSTAIDDKEWVLDKGLTLIGSVHGYDGNALAGMQVTVSPASPGGGATDAICESDDRGAFECSGLDSGTYEAGVRSQEGRFLTDKVQVDVGTDRQTIDLVVHPLGEIQVTVTDVDGTPLDNTPVSARDDDGQVYSGKKVGGGIFAVRDVPPGAYKIVLSTSDGRDGSGNVTVRAGEVAQVKLVHPRPKGEVTGQVLDANGGGIPDVWIQLAMRGAAGSADGWQIPPTLTDKEGAFRVADLNEGEYTLQAEHPTLGRTELAIQTGSPVRVVLSSPATLSGVVKDQRGTPVPDFQLEYYAGTEGGGRRFSSADGSWTLGPMSPGNVTLRVSAQKGSLTKQLSVAPGQELSGVELVLQ